MTSSLKSQNYTTIYKINRLKDIIFRYFDILADIKERRLIPKSSYMYRFDSNMIKNDLAFVTYTLYCLIRNLRILRVLQEQDASYDSTMDDMLLCHELMNINNLYDIHIMANMTFDDLISAVYGCDIVKISTILTDIGFTRESFDFWNCLQSEYESTIHKIETLSVDGLV